MLKVLLPVDGSDNSLRAVTHALGTRIWYRDPPEYHLLNVQLPVASGAVKMFISREQLNDFYQEEGETALKVAREALQSAGVVFHAKVAVGEVATTIARYAKEQEVSLITMGTRGMGSVRNLVLGSVAAKVIHLAEVPVLLIK
jgi:nucleotide-binding universal stress UspA family protein